MATHAEDIQRQMQARATERLLSSGDWVSAEDMARLIPRSSRSLQAVLQDWVDAGLLFSIQHEGVSLFPLYALDAGTGSPQEGLRAVLALLQGAGHHAWAIAWWLDSPNSYLDGKRPKDCLAGPRDELLRAARAEADGIQHG